MYNNKMIPLTFWDILFLRKIFQNGSYSCALTQLGPLISIIQPTGRVFLSKVTYMSSSDRNAVFTPFFTSTALLAHYLLRISFSIQVDYCLFVLVEFSYKKRCPIIKWRLYIEMQYSITYLYLDSISCTLLLRIYIALQVKILFVCLFQWMPHTKVRKKVSHQSMTITIPMSELSNDMF